jgi:threonine dehydrogenase-like Zn-dependent dehydrogenase
MKAAVFAGPGRLELQERPEPSVLGHEFVLVEVECCGLCGSDVHALAVPPGHPSAAGVILGHEIVGRVVDRGDGVSDPKIGERVVVDPDPSCGTCYQCRRGMPEVCELTRPNGVYRDGGLARFCSVHARAAFSIADHVPGPVAALAEPFACVVNALRHVAAAPGESAVVFGGGAMGTMSAAMLHIAGAAPVVMVEPAERRREVAVRCGADVALSPRDFEEQRRGLLPRGADIVVEAVGSLLQAAIAAAATGGRIVLVGMDSRARASIHQNELVQRSLSIVGSYITHFTFPRAIALLEHGTPDLSPIVTHVLALDEVAAGIELLRTGEAMKVVIDLSPDGEQRAA